MKIYICMFLALSLLMLGPSPAHAYVGPGLGAGTIAVILGFIGSVFLALFALFWYPFKRIFQKFKSKKAKPE